MHVTYTLHITWDPGHMLGPDRLSITIAEDGEGRLATVSGAGAWEAKLKEVHV